MRSTCAGVGIGLAAWLLGGCGTTEWVARDAFGEKYACPSDQVNVRQKLPATTMKGQPLPGYTDLSVGGCGVETRYRCHNADADRGGTHNVCVERVRAGIQATDGSVYVTMQDDPGAGEVQDRALLASAAHDLPCALASIRLVSRDPAVVDGCGQRLTYRREAHELRPPPGYVVDGSLQGYREVLMSRATVPVLAPTPGP